MTFNLGAVAFSSTHWKSTIKVQAHPAELNMLVKVPQTAIKGAYNQLRQGRPLTTSGQVKYNQRVFAFLLLTTFLDKTDCSKTF